MSPDSTVLPVKKAASDLLFSMDGGKLALLARISQIIGSDLGLSEVLKRVVNVTADLMGSKICSIFLYDRERGLLDLAATQSLSDKYRKKPPLSAKKSISGRAVAAFEPQIVPDVSLDDGFGYRDLAATEGIVSLLCVPMVVKGVAKGTINSYTSKMHAYTRDEVNMLTLVAGQAAIAIENAQLHEARLAAETEIDRKNLLHQAKLVLMKDHQMDEPLAHRFIQKQSMDQRRPVEEIARKILMNAAR